MRNVSVAAAALAALVLSSCGEGRAPEPAAAPFTYVATNDLSGYYRPTEGVRSDRWTLDHVFMGQAQAFQAWEAGRRSGDFAPVMMQFSSDGGAVRVLPTRYSIDDARIEFEGRSPELGRVRFSVRLDPGALATARRNLGDEGAVMTGSLKAGDNAATPVRLRWWMGD